MNEVERFPITPDLFFGMIVEDRFAKDNDAYTLSSDFHALSHALIFL